jgi:hypothetical protein
MFFAFLFVCHSRMLQKMLFLLLFWVLLLKICAHGAMGLRMFKYMLKDDFEDYPYLNEKLKDNAWPYPSDLQTTLRHKIQTAEFARLPKKVQVLKNLNPHDQSHHLRNHSEKISQGKKAEEIGRRFFHKKFQTSHSQMQTSHSVMEALAELVQAEKDQKIPSHLDLLHQLAEDIRVLSLLQGGGGSEPDDVVVSDVDMDAQMDALNEDLAQMEEDHDLYAEMVEGERAVALVQAAEDRVVASSASQIVVSEESQIVVSEESQIVLSEDVLQRNALKKTEALAAKRLDNAPQKTLAAWFAPESKDAQKTAGEKNRENRDAEKRRATEAFDNLPEIKAARLEAAADAEAAYAHMIQDKIIRHQEYGSDGPANL